MLLLKLVNALIMATWFGVMLFAVYLLPVSLPLLFGVGILTFTLATFASELVQEHLIEKFNKT